MRRGKKETELHLVNDLLAVRLLMRVFAFTMVSKETSPTLKMSQRAHCATNNHTHKYDFDPILIRMKMH